MINPTTDATGHDDGEYDFLDEESDFELDIESFDPDASDYRPTDYFMKRRKSSLDGIFTGEVIQACFNGEYFEAENECAMAVGELHECFFGLILGADDQVVIDGKVLQVNPVQASMSGHWSSDVVTRMQSLAKNHEGKIWNAHKDPRVGNKERWVPERDHTSVE